MSTKKRPSDLVRGITGDLGENGCSWVVRLKHGSSGISGREELIMGILLPRVVK